MSRLFMKPRATMTPFRRLLPMLVVCLLAIPAGSSSAETITAKQRGEIEKIVQDYLLQNPEFMLEVFERVTSYQKEQEDKRVRDNLVRLNEELYHDPNSVTIGNPKADVAIVEFFDYRCSYCKTESSDYHYVSRGQYRRQNRLQGVPDPRSRIRARFTRRNRLAPAGASIGNFTTPLCCSAVS